MSAAIITVESLSKRYLVGRLSNRPRGYSALRDVIGGAVRGLARKTKAMVQGRQIIQGGSVEEFWALREVSFDVREGEVVGIIGRNGAGKSTLLKILSRITEPTEGRVTLKGRVASLLEVGTGFHPELTGRENIFLNGAILGMRRGEIRGKFDEIVAFAEVERFLDTPVKRYSSGMYVRLAFAVAAHLEPEILVVDEVLAVGDAQFQRKCLGKMTEVASRGRTVLFVSHNLHAVAHLCQSSIVLDKGRVTFRGAADAGVRHYLTGAGGEKAAWYQAPQRQRTPHVVAARVLGPQEASGPALPMHQPITIQVQVECCGEPEVNCSVVIKNSQGLWIVHTSDEFSPHPEKQKSSGLRRCILPPYALNADEFTLSLALGTRQGGEIFQRLDDVLSFEVTPSGSLLERIPGSSFRGVTGPGLPQWA